MRSPWDPCGSLPLAAWKAALGETDTITSTLQRAEMGSEALRGSKNLFECTWLVRENCGCASEVQAPSHIEIYSCVISKCSEMKDRWDERNF